MAALVHDMYMLGKYNTSGYILTISLSFYYVNTTDPASGGKLSMWTNISVDDRVVFM